MKIFGYEAAFAPALPVAAEDLDVLLDAMHETLVADARLYSADVVAEGKSSLALLLGVQVDDDEGIDDAQRYAEEAVTRAFRAGGAEVPAMNPTSRAVRELVDA